MAMMERRNSLTARPLTDRRGLWLIAGFVVVFFVGTVALVLETANARPSDDVRLMLSSQESPEKYVAADSRKPTEGCRAAY